MRWRNWQKRPPIKFLACVVNPRCYIYLSYAVADNSMQIIVAITPRTCARCKAISFVCHLLSAQKWQDLEI